MFTKTSESTSLSWDLTYIFVKAVAPPRQFIACCSRGQPDTGRSGVDKGKAGQKQLNKVLGRLPIHSFKLV